MPTPIKLPNLGVDATEAKILSWLRHPGDIVTAGEALAEIETEKANVDVVAPVSGRLSVIEAPEGAVVAVGTVIAEIEDV
jgi:pyruvate/2-oxoglutarate dehydrogenase complex dihydrolipoamide acyltransferase (E2) component